MDPYDLTVRQIKEQLRARGVRLTGNKATLQNRLLDTLDIERREVRRQREARRRANDESQRKRMADLPDSKNPFKTTFKDLQEQARVGNPTARGAVLEALKKIDSMINPETGEKYTVDELDRMSFDTPTYDRGDGSSVLVGQGPAVEAEKAARASLESKGVSTGGGGGGGGGFGGGYSEEISSEQWQRIRNGSLTEDEAEWENDPDNYDEDGNMYEYGYYPDEDEDDEFI